MAVKPTDNDDSEGIRPLQVSGELTIPALVEGLHAQIFGIHSMGDPAASHAALADGGQIHEAVHALVRALPPIAALSTQSGDIARLRPP